MLFKSEFRFFITFTTLVQQLCKCYNITFENKKNVCHIFFNFIFLTIGMIFNKIAGRIVFQALFKPHYI